MSENKVVPLPAYLQERCKHQNVDPRDPLLLDDVVLRPTDEGLEVEDDAGFSVGMITGKELMRLKVYLEVVIAYNKNNL